MPRVMRVEGGRPLHSGESACKTCANFDGCPLLAAFKGTAKEKKPVRKCEFYDFVDPVVMLSVPTLAEITLELENDEITKGEM